MAYVPVVPTTPSPPPSPRTRELAALLTRVLEEYRKSHPATTDAEVRAAVRLAQLSTRSGSQATPLLVSLALGILVAGVLAGVLVFRSEGGVEWSAAMPMVIFAVVAFLLILMIVIKVLSR